MKKQKHLQLIILSLFLVFGFAAQSVFAAPVCGNATTCNWKNEDDIITSNAGATPYPDFKMCSVGVVDNLHINYSTDPVAITGFGWNCVDNTTVQCTAGYASTSYCPTIINGVCGSVNNTNVEYGSLTTSSSNLCSAGTVANWNSPPTIYDAYWWTCNGSGGGTNSDWCIAHVKVNGACGSQSSPTSGGVTSGSLTSSSSNLCSVGTVANFQIFNGGDGDAYWWTCNGAYDGTNSDWCLIHIKQDGVLGTANNHTYASTDTSWGSYTQCSVGNSSNTTFPSLGGSTSWYCSGLWTGTNSGTGIAYREAAAVNGSCGTANGHGYPSTSYIDTSAERCAVGTFTSFTDNGSSWGWSCTGSGGGTTASCSAPKVSCGSYHNTIRRDQPSTNLCTYGSNTTLSLASNKWSWSCTNNPGINASCYTYKTSCGSSNGGTYTSVPTSLCTYGTASSVTSGTSTYTWTCTGNDSLPVSCSATRNYVVTYTSSTGGSCTPSSRTVAYNGTSAAPTCTPSSGYTLVGFTRTSGSGGTLNTSTGAVTSVTGSQTIRADFGINGSCGTADGHTYASTDSSWTPYTQCATGTPSSTTFPETGSSVNWTCLGQNGGTDSGTCSASRTVGISCGSYHDTTRRDQPSTNLCVSSENTSLVLNNNTWYWNCESEPETPAACYTYKTSCGSSNGGTFVSAPETNLCTYGDPSLVTTGSTTYTWTCTGDDTLAVSCSATIDNSVDGVCGSSNGGSFTTAPLTGLCDAGDPSDVIDNTTTFDWTCDGINGGTNDTCSATQLEGNCGSACNETSLTPPSTNLCNTNYISSLISEETDSWNWVCDSVSSSDWYDVSWTKRQAIKISHSGSLTDYQIKITVPYDSNMQADFDDIRFTSSDGTTLLSYWLESKTDSSEANFWIKVPLITTDTTIYLYYGNSSATSASDPDSTFIFFDDFESYSVGSNPTKFDSVIQGTNTTVKVSNTQAYGGTKSLFFDKQDSTVAAIKKYVSEESKTVLEYRIRLSTNSKIIEAGQANNNQGTNSASTIYWGGTISCRDNGSYTSTGQTYNANQWYWVKLLLNNNLNTYVLELPDNSYTSSSFGYDNDYPVDRLRFPAGNTESFSYYIDDVIYRKYADVEPTYSFVASEESVNVAWYYPSWTKRKSINIYSLEAATDYQIKVTVPYDSDMLSDFADIRFTDFWGTELSYWLESKTNLSTATFWVKVPSITVGNTTIYLYYGNSSATSVSDPDNTFIFFDDFESYSVGSDPTKFEIIGQGTDTTIKVSDDTAYNGSKSLKFYSNDETTAGTTKYPITFPNRSLVEVKIKVNQTNSTKEFLQIYGEDSGSNYATVRLALWNDGYIKYYDGTSWISTGKAYSTGQWITVIINLYHAAKVYDLVLPDYSYSQRLNFIYEVYNNRLRFPNSTQIGTYYIDFVNIRTRVNAADPVISLGEYEEAVNPVICSSVKGSNISATSLLSPLDIDSNASCWYCDKYLEGESVISGKSGNLEFKFTYTDSNSEAKIIGYDFAISQGSDPLNPVFSDSIDLSINPLSPNTIITYNNASVKRNGENALLKQIAYNKIYNWWVKVHNDKGASSDWVQASSTFTTPSRAFPLVRVVPQKSSLVLDESTLMCSTTDSVYRGEDQSGCFDACWTGEGDTATLDPNNLDNGWNCSICYNTSQSPVLCSSGNNNTFTWSLVNGSADLTNTTNNNVTITATNTGEEIRTRLLITGSDGCVGEQGEGEGSYPSLPLPTWKEVGN